MKTTSTLEKISKTYPRFYITSTFDFVSFKMWFSAPCYTPVYLPRNFSKLLNLKTYSAIFFNKQIKIYIPGKSSLPSCHRKIACFPLQPSALHTLDSQKIITGMLFYFLNAFFCFFSPEKIPLNWKKGVADGSSAVQIYWLITGLLQIKVWVKKIRHIQKLTL